MNFPSEQPVSVVKAWNMLCEAVLERMSYYQLPSSLMTDRKFFTLPDVPCRRDVPNDIGAMIRPLRDRITDLINLSYDWRQFGAWQVMDKSSLTQKADDPLLTSWGIDPCAFWQIPEKIPSYRHTVSEFIKAAWQAVNDIIRYPLPLFGSNAGFMKGFDVHCTLTVYRENQQQWETAEYSETGPLATVNNWAALDLRDLAHWVRDLYRGRAYAHRWHYHRETVSYRSCRYTLPQLCGIGRIRCNVQVETQSGVTVMDEMQEYDMDFTAGCAAKEMDFSAISDRISHIFSGAVADDPEYAGQRRVFLRLIKNQEALLLNAENFPKLPYKYLTVQ